MCIRDRGGGEHQAIHPSGTGERQLKGGQSAEAEPEEVRPVDPEVVQQPHHVVGQVRERRVPVDVTGVPVPLQFDGDDLPRRGECGQHAAEGQVDGEQPAVQQDQRLSRAMDLVVQIQPVDPRISGGRRIRARLLSLTHRALPGSAP